MFTQTILIASYLILAVSCFQITTYRRSKTDLASFGNGYLESLSAKLDSNVTPKQKSVIASADALLKQESNQRSLLKTRLEMEQKIRAHKTEKSGKHHDREATITIARKQPKSPEEERALAERYGSMNLEERAFNILVDLGMIFPSNDPDSPNYDKSADFEFAAENKWP